MEAGDVMGLIAVVSLFIFLPWIILHYVTRWKTAATLTTGMRRCSMNCIIWRDGSKIA